MDIVEIIRTLGHNVWNDYTIGLLLGTGLLLTIFTKFIQIRKFTRVVIPLSSIPVVALFLPLIPC